jgi:hypothetical protein
MTQWLQVYRIYAHLFVDPLINHSTSNLAGSNCPQLTPRRSPRRSPRNSPIRSELNANKLVSSAGGGTVLFGPAATRPATTADSRDSGPSSSVVIQAVQAPTSDAANEDLLAQLAMLKIQNNLLNSRIQRAQEESHQQLEEERTQRLAVVTELTRRNLKLSEELNASQLAAQQQLQQEKEMFIRAMHVMQTEREELDLRVRQAQELAENEAKLARMQKAQLSDNMQQLEGEKEELQRRLASHAQLVKQLQISQIEISAPARKARSSDAGGTSDAARSGKRGGAAATVGVGADLSARAGSARHGTGQKGKGSDGADSDRGHVFSFLPAGTQESEGDYKLALLQAEMTRMAQSLEQVTQQKLTLGAAMLDSETTATENHMQLTQQLQTEKERLELRVSKMCAEQEAMRSRLAQAEAAVQAQLQLAEEQAAAERSERSTAEATLALMQEQQKALLERISEAKSASFTNKDSSATPLEKSLSYLDGADIPEQGQEDLLSHALAGVGPEPEADGVQSSAAAGPTSSDTLSNRGSPAAASKLLGRVASTLSLPSGDIPLPPSAPPAAGVSQVDLDRQLAEMTAAMLQLKRDLELKEQQALERERAMQEQNSREKEELKRAVQKMREDLEAERKQQEQQYLQETQGGDGYYGEGEGYYDAAGGEQQQLEGEYGYGDGYEGYYDEGYEGGGEGEWTQEQIDEYYRQYGYEHGAPEGYDAQYASGDAYAQHYDGHEAGYYEGQEYHSEQQGAGYHGYDGHYDASAALEGNTSADHSSGTCISGEAPPNTGPLTPVTPNNGPAFTYPPVASRPSTIVAGTSDDTGAESSAQNPHASSAAAVGFGGSPSQAAAKVMLKHGSRQQLRRPSKQGSAIPVGLVSHKSLFELLASEYKPGNYGSHQLGGSKRDVLQLQAPSAGSGADGYTISAMPGPSVPQGRPHDANFTTGRSAAPSTAADAEGAAGGSKQPPATSVSSKTQKSKTIMDLDSDSEEETSWGKDTALKPLTGKNSPPKPGAVAAVNALAKVPGKETSSAGGSAPATTAAGADDKEKKLSVKEALKERLNRNKRARRKAPFGKAPPSAAAQDRAAVDMEKLAGLPAPHAAGNTWGTGCCIVLLVAQYVLVASSVSSRHLE